MSAEQKTLQQLPDDVLVLVMQHLAVNDLFACRLVCQRLATLALHPEVWRHRRLDDETCVCAVLSLAPCLDKIVYSKKAHTAAFMTTRCAVRHLTLHIKKGTECALACLAVRNQESLGRLRNVELEVWYSSEDVAPLDGADVLLRTLVERSSALESLDLLNGLPKPYAMRPVLHGPLRSSLRYFRCELAERYENIVNTVLAGHAATLQEVHLGHEYCEKSTYELLVGMSELRGLTCRLFPGMQALASCEMMRDVSFSMFDEYTPETVVQGAAEFFRLASQLRTVAIVFQYADCEQEYFEDLMGALASSGESLVHQLSIVGLLDAQPLLRALPRLPALQVLGVLNSPLIEPCDDGRVDELLVGITPTTAPSLRRLEVATFDFTGCLHEWLHRDVVARVLTANHSLHVHVWGAEGCRRRMQGGRWVACEACAMGCHREVTANYNDSGRRIGFFSHGPEQCTHPEDHVTGGKWTWVHIRCNSD